MKYIAISAACLTLTVSAGEVDKPAAPLPLAVLLDAAQATVAACSANGYSVTVTVIDADLSKRIVLRADGAFDRTVDIGWRKAYTVIKTGMSSGDFGKTIPPNPVSAPRANPMPPGPPPLPGPINGDPNLITWAGGLPIRIDGILVGAISASGAPGGEKDEACVNAGLAKIAKAPK